MTNTNPEPTLSIQDNLSKSWETYKKQWQLLLLGTVIISVPDLISTAHAESTGSSFNILQLILGLLSFFLVAGGIDFILKIVRNKEAKIEDIVGQKDMLWQFFLGNLVVSLMSIVGFILLVIPGIIVSVMYSFVPMLIIDKKMEFKTALQTSKTLTQNIKLKLFKYFFVSGLIGCSGLVLFGVGIILTMPLMMLMFALAYEEVIAFSEAR